VTKWWTKMLAAPAMQNKHAQATMDDGMAPHPSPTREAKRAHLFRRWWQHWTQHRHTLGLALTLLAAVVFACSQQDPADERVSEKPAPVQVQQRYGQARSFGGHALHVSQKQLPCESCHTLDGATFDRPAPDKCIACHTAQGATSSRASAGTRSWGA
jgi:hypothetical protein